MTRSGKRTLYFVLGEESGDALGADLFRALKTKADHAGEEIEIRGLAGTQLTKLGVESLFNIEDIAVMGISAVLGRLPTIISRVRSTVADIVKAQPDIIILIDSPDFTHAVAKRVRKRMPLVPILNYVCPSVWAWRSGRAKSMTAWVDHVLAILPFEPAALRNLGGPSATFVGHDMARQVEAFRAETHNVVTKPKPILLVLPGSRGSELKRLLKDFELALEMLTKRGVDFNAVLPAVPHLKEQLTAAVSQWSTPVTITDSADNNQTFASADAALAVSGTVSLQLALHRVPMVLTYKLDPVARPLGFLIKPWSAALPNLVAGWPLVPEEFNEMVHPDRLARRLQRLLTDTPERAAQLAGFDHIIDVMATDTAPADKAAEVVLSYLP